MRSYPKGFGRSSPPPPLNGLNPSDHVSVIRVALAYEQGRFPQARANLIKAAHWIISPGLLTPRLHDTALRKEHPKVYRLPHPVPVRFELNTCCIDAAITKCGRIAYQVQFWDGDRAHNTLREIAHRGIERLAGERATAIQERTSCIHMEIGRAS